MAVDLLMIGLGMFVAGTVSRGNISARLSTFLFSASMGVSAGLIFAGMRDIVGN